MKAKSNYSSLVEEALAKATMGGIAAVTIFVGVFFVWSVTCLGGAIVSLLG
jgi:cytochrome c oxidase assembly factor CtaG